MPLWLRTRTRSFFVTSALAGSWLIQALVAPGALHAQTQTYTCPAPGGFEAVPPVLPPPPATLMGSLKSVPNPVLPNGANGVPRADLVDYIANQPAAIQLGKALFWEMQAGSDNKTACATCHFKAGADGRDKNQLNPGANGAFNAGAPNTQLPAAPISPAYDDVAGSQGIRRCSFQGFSKTGVELTASVSDPVFNAGGVTVRQVTGKNTPTVINSVFNHRNFWDGRAQPEFNGASPFGNRDSTARVWVLDYRGFPVQVAIVIQNASLASQAVGPPLNTVEMSASGRTFPDLGRKLLALKPLGTQVVSPADSVLGPLADPALGLKTTYKALIQQAFQPKWWNSNKSVTVGSKSYAMMEANFSLFWGISIMLYQATLVSDNSPMDLYLASRVFDANGNLVSSNTSLLVPLVQRLQPDLPGLTVDRILNGLALFELPAAPPPSFPAPAGFGIGCIACHAAAETTSASVRNLAGPGVEVDHVALKNAGLDMRMERMFTNLSWTPPGPLSPVPQGADTITLDPVTYAVNVTRINGAQVAPTRLPQATYDTGWYNLGVRPTAEDPGLDGQDPFGKPLSWTRFFQQTTLDPSFIKVPGNTLGCAGMNLGTVFPNQLLNASGLPLLSGPLTKTEAVDVAGSFKVPGLRNVEFTAPYFHNGGKSTLAQVMSFYAVGGEFSNPTKAPAMVPLALTADQIRNMVAFMLALTDERVRWQQAPFDHPQLFVPNGANAAGTDNLIEIPAIGASGSTAPLQRFLNLNPFSF